MPFISLDSRREGRLGSG